jgi:uncharacterized protein (TIGR02246 family)
VNTDDAAAIRELVARYLAAYEVHDAAGCGALYTEDAMLLSPWGPPVTGRNGVAAAHGEWFKAGESNKVMAIHRLAVDGDIGLALSRYAADVPADDGGTRRVYGASLSTLCRQKDGVRKIQYSSLNELDEIETGFGP